ncbi:ATP-binding protein [Ideonella sp.]|jgi:predicted AAA+ superfamily ATPase|uniref:ATP-binding protein n=1 Tax=Ideonella sp. TaxID=1929293 RepID=UPI0037C06AD5
MIDRQLLSTLEVALADYPAVALLGARQVGKTTLARQVGDTRSAVYLDIERPSDRQKLTDPEAYLTLNRQRLVILDEVQHMPELFPVLRSLIDEGRRPGQTGGRFLLLGSASGELLRQSGESLAGRVAYLELPPLQTLELPQAEQTALWLRGGFPNSLLASSDAKSLTWRQNLISTYLERELPSYGARIPAQTLRRLWTMLAHLQGGLLDASQLAKSLMIDAKTVHRYLDMLTDLMLMRKLPPWHSNLGKRLVKSPKIYVRDSGLLHALLGLPTHEALLAHPVVGNSWEGFAIETLLNAAPREAQCGFYRSSNGAEIDLLVETPSLGLMAIEVKRSTHAKPRRGFYSACEDLQPRHRFLVHGGTDDEPYPVGDGVTAITLRGLSQRLTLGSA